MDLEVLAADVIDQALRLHRDLGPGLLESVYETILAGKLAKLGYEVRRQQVIDIEYEDFRFEAAFRIDLIVDGRLLVEIKSVERLNAVHAKQLLTYLRLMNQPLGLLINFGSATLKEGLQRVVNSHTSFESSRLRANQNNGSEECSI